MVWLSWGVLAVQGAVVVGISERHDSGVTGTFARPVELSDGWWLTWGAGGDLLRAPLSELDGWTVDDGRRMGVLGRDDLVDHGLVPCPDGSWLHVGSAGRVDADDSSYAHWLDAGMELVDQTVVEEEEPARVHNDPSVLCGRDFSGVVHTGREPGEPSWWFALEGGAATAPQELVEAPRMAGAGLHEAGGELLTVSVWNFIGELQLNRYDTDLVLLEDPLQQPVLADDEGIWWPTGVVAVGTHLVVATMGKQVDDPWAADTGEVWLLVLDASLQVVEEHRVDTLEPPDGAMRPWLVRDGGRLLLTADIELEPVLWVVTLDLDAAGPEPGLDSGEPGNRVGGGCGCEAMPGLPSSWGLALVALWARSRRQVVFG